MPSKVQFAQRFGVSRPTVARALRDLEADGLISRRAGSGTYVELSDAQSTFTFGLLMPDLGDAEIVEPICQGLAQAAHVRIRSFCGDVLRRATRNWNRRKSSAISYSKKSIGRVLCTRRAPNRERSG